MFRIIKLLIEIFLFNLLLLYHLRKHYELILNFSYLILFGFTLFHKIVNLFLQLLN